MDQRQLDQWALNDTLLSKLPTRATERGGWTPRLEMRSGTFKMAESKRQRVYWAYYDYVMACPWYNHATAAGRMSHAHFKGHLGVAYLECYCRECRFISNTCCPESFDTILAAYHKYYPEESERVYGYESADGETERDGVDERRFLAESSCLMVALFRRRHLDGENA